ncbi:MAG: DUF1232 domain-containing protein [Bacteroidaceae bacterium]|nr:DUF1232 domain-containing protein [Bacteroidaceae bacterium]
MVTKAFIQSFKKLSRQIKDDSDFCLVDKDGKIFYVHDITSDAEKVYIHFKKAHGMQAKQVYKRFREFNGRKEKDPDLSKDVCALSEDGLEYDFKGYWTIDTDNDIRATIVEQQTKSSSLKYAQKYKKGFRNEYKNESFFTEAITKIARKMGITLVYVAYSLYYALKQCPLNPKSLAIITGALGYLFTPIDLVNDLIPFIGFSDDATILIAAYHAVMSSLSPKDVARISQMAKAGVKSIFGDVSDKELKF